MSVFKIPKRSRPDLDSVQTTSPLSRLQPSPDPQTFSSFPVRSVSMTNSNQHRSALSTRFGARAQPFSNGWRPKRASDRLLFPPLSPKQQKLPESAGSAEDSPEESIKTYTADTKPGSSFHPISVRSSDALALLRAQRHHGNSSPDRKRLQSHDAPTRQQDTPIRQQDMPFKQQHTPTRQQNSPTKRQDTSTRQQDMPTTRQEKPPTESVFDLSDVREKQRQKWRLFKEKKQLRSQAKIRDQGQDRDPGQNKVQNHGHQTNIRSMINSEPIVLSSEEEEERTNYISTRPQLSDCALSRVAPPPFLMLDFSSFHLGLSCAQANGQIMISDSGINVPLRGFDGEEAQLCVVANQVQAFGLWDGGVARGGTLFKDTAHNSSVPAPSLLFFSVTNSQAKVLQTELREILPGNTDPLCSLVLLVLKHQLSGLDSALVLSLLDSGNYRESRSGSGVLDWAEGLVLVHSCPPPVDAHLLQLLGQGGTGTRTRTGLRSAAQSLPSRLIVYPAAPSKGRIAVSTEDLQCLKHGEFLNDVIIDFYLKYLLLEGMGGAVAQRSHVFSSFFYKQLSKRRAAGEDNANIPDRHTRHRRVRTWTRNVDIFSKDFVFIPVNQESHWFLVLVCFPGLEQCRQEEFSPSSEVIRPGVGLRSQTPPECTLKGCRRNSVLKRPCLLVMDSLKLSVQDAVSRLIRDYLAVEWEQRRGSKRLFSAETFKSFSCRVPQQDNSSDCGLYLLQYTQVFLQNPVVTFEPPVRLETWFPRQQVRAKRDQIRDLILRLHRDQNPDQE